MKFDEDCETVYYQDISHHQFKFFKILYGKTEGNTAIMLFVLTTVFSMVLISSDPIIVPINVKTLPAAVMATSATAILAHAERSQYSCSLDIDAGCAPGTHSSLSDVQFQNMEYISDVDHVIGYGKMYGAGRKKGPVEVLGDACTSTSADVMDDFCKRVSDITDCVGVGRATIHFFF
jgi:hypothetical protein